jgi:hypothetical protein
MRQSEIEAQWCWSGRGKCRAGIMEVIYEARIANVTGGEWDKNG